MDPKTGGLIGGIIGVVIGVAGGAIGTYFSIKNTRTPAERRFMVRGAAVFWAAATTFVAVILLNVAGVIPRWTYWVVFGIFIIALMPAIACINKRQATLRQENTGSENNQE